MPFVTARCPQCGGELKLDDQKESGFCMHCGSKILVQEAINAVRIDNSHMVNTWLKMGDSAFEARNIAEAYDYYTRVIEVQPENYEAIYKKAKAAGWQSTLIDMRFQEATHGFAQAINLAPENEKEELRNKISDDVKNLALAIIALRMQRFDDWPDKEETIEFVNDFYSIQESTIILEAMGGFEIKNFSEELASEIYTYIKKTYELKIQPEYLGEENRPFEYELKEYINRLICCVTILKTLLELDISDEKKIQYYKILIFLENEALNSCSWDYEFTDFGKRWHKEYVLSESAKNLRRINISKYNKEIVALEKNIQKTKEAARLEKDKKRKKEAKKRFDQYWDVNKERKNQLLEKKGKLLNQIQDLEKEKEKLSSNLISDRENIISERNKLNGIKESLGLFKIKEKRSLQEDIDKLNNQLESISSEIEKIQSPFLDKITKLNNKIKDIDDELTKPR